MKKCCILFIIFFITCLFSSGLYSAEKTRIAVISLEAQDVSKTTANAISDMIITEMINSKEFQVVERSQVDEILSEQGLQQTGCTDQSCAVEIGKLISANKILIGSVSKVGKRTVINIRMVDVEKGVGELAAMEQAESDDDIPDAVEALVEKIEDEIEASISKASEQFTMSGYYLRGIVPGWGQIYAGSSTKGYIFMAGFVLAGASAVYGVIDFNAKRTEYLELPRGTAQSEFNEKNDAKNTAGILALSMIGLTGLVYIANWVDLLFINETPPVHSASNMAGAGNICFNAGLDSLSPFDNDKHYTISMGIKF